MCNSDARHQRQKTDLQSIVKDNCKHLSADRQRIYCSFSLMSRFLDGTLGDSKINPVSFHFQAKEENK